MTDARPAPHLTIVVLTFNEARHIERALRSVAGLADRCVVVDSGSSDDTVTLARAVGAEVLIHPFVNQAQQFNWALDQLRDDTDWVFRLDADEVVSDALVAEISSSLARVPSDIAGLTVARRIEFLGRRICHGGLFPVHILRLFRYGRGRCEDRWMDEHIVVDGGVLPLSGEMLDINLNPLSWWIEKHNRYASREAVELLNLEFGFMPRKTTNALSVGKQAKVKRWLKTKVYVRLPSGLRASAYFFYRYILRLGFLDGCEGTAFHILQGFWYRYLVDLKVTEVRIYMSRRNVNVITAIERVLDIRICE